MITNGRLVTFADDAEWVSSPADGVERRMLEREGGEVARATSIVRFRPGSRFDRHVHGLVEEFLVLKGTFSDEYGDYPAGSYVRNPPGSGHTPFSKPGCRILVKLRQFDANDLSQFAIDTTDSRGWVGSTLTLHEFGPEHVFMQRVEAHVSY